MIEQKQPTHDTLMPLSQEAQSLTLQGVYRHYKGNNYRLLAVARHSETLEEYVVYEGLYGKHDIWVRPLSLFRETILIDNKPQPRFTFIPPELRQVHE